MMRYTKAPDHYVLNGAHLQTTDAPLQLTLDLRMPQRTQLYNRVNAGADLAVKTLPRS